MTRRRLWDDYRDTPELTPRGATIAAVVVYLVLLAIVLLSVQSAQVDWDVWSWAAGRIGH